jgi:hypothetical protein
VRSLTPSVTERKMLEREIVKMKASESLEIAKRFLEGMCEYLKILGAISSKYKIRQILSYNIEKKFHKTGEFPKDPAEIPGESLSFRCKHRD